MFARYLPLQTLFGGGEPKLNFFNCFWIHMDYKQWKELYVACSVLNISNFKESNVKIFSISILSLRQRLRQTSSNKFDLLGITAVYFCSAKAVSPLQHTPLVSTINIYKDCVKNRLYIIFWPWLEFLFHCCQTPDPNHHCQLLQTSLCIPWKDCKADSKICRYSQQLKASNIINLKRR